MNSYTLYLLFAALTTLTLAVVCFRRIAAPGARPFMLLMLAVTVWSFAYGFEISSKSLAMITFWARIEYIGIVFIPVLWLIFAFQYTGRKQWLTRRNLILFSIVPILALVSFWTNSAHELFWRDISLVEIGNMTLAIFTHGAGFWVNATYTYLLLLTGTVLIIQNLVRSGSLFQKQGLTLLAGVLAPWIGNAIYLMGIFPMSYLDPTPFAFTITGLTITWGLFRYQLLDVVPIARTTLVTNMPDGVIVLDSQNRIVDLNPAAVRIFKQPIDEPIGQDAELFFQGHPEILIALRSDNATPTKVVIVKGWDERYYDLRLSLLNDKKGTISGRLIVFRDVTEQKISEEALDRRGAIMEAISFAATNYLSTLDWEKFIHETLQRLGESAAVSRVYCFEKIKSEDANTLVTQHYEWVADGISPQINNPEFQGFNLQERGFSRWEEMFGLRQPVYGVVAEFPASEQEVLFAQDILAIAVVPIYLGDDWWGFIGYDDCVSERQWSKAEIYALEAAAGIIGSSIQRKIIDNQQRQRSNELAELYELSLEIPSSQEISQLLQTIVDRAVGLIGGTGGEFFLCDHDKEEVRCVTSSIIKSDYSGVVLKYGEGASGTVAQTGQALIIDDYRIWEGRAMVHEGDQPFRSVICAPLSWLDEVMGVVLIVHNQETSRFNEDNLRMLKLFASQAAIALNNLQMYQSSQQRARKVALLNDLTTASLEIGDLATMLEYLSERMVELLDADGCAISLWNDHQNQAIPTVSFGSLHNIFFNRSDNSDVVEVLEEVLATRKTIIVEEISETPYIPSKLAQKFPARSFICTPLITGKQKIGTALITFDEEHRFTQDETTISDLAAAQLALAIAKARLLETERHRVNELDALRATMTDISGELELSTLLTIILERATTLLNATGGDLGLYEQDKEEILIVVSHNMGKDYQGTRMALGEGAMGRAVENNESVIISNYRHWKNRSLQYEDGPWETVLAVPLHFRGQIVGALGIVDKNSERTFTQEDQRLLNLFAQQAAIAIKNAHIYAQEKNRVAELEILYESSANVTKTLDLNKVYNIAAKQLAQAVKATSSYIMSCDLKSGKSIVLGNYASPMANEEESKSDVGSIYDLEQFQQTLTALRNGRPLTIKISDPSIDQSDLKEFKKYNLKCSLCVPMIITDNLIGYVEVWDSREERNWSDEEIRLCQILANQAAVAIENARLYNEIHHQAITDTLTGIYNRRGLFEIGQREVYRARRYERPLAAIMLDIDHFKQINDKYSHAVGDQVLQFLTKTCASNLRKTDIFGRYGGEEFSIILPEIDQINAVHLAERLRKLVESTPFQTESGSINITISIGIAGITDEIEDLAVLLDKADTAMYSAKRAGRNRVVVDGVAVEKLQQEY